MGRATGSRSDAGFLSDFGGAMRGLWDTGASALRGATAATLGAPGDIAELLAENGLVGPLGAATRAYGRRASEVLPTTERVRELLPETGARGFGPVERLAEYVPVDPRAAVSASARAAGAVGRGGLGVVSRMVEEGHPLFAAAQPFRAMPPGWVNAPSELTVYHGTPHVFAPEEGAPLGRFRMDKLGTGEGAQAFGHGLYFTGHAPLAEKTYRQGLIDQMVEGLESARTAGIHQSVKPQLDEYARQSGIPKSVLSEIMKRARAGTKAEYKPRLDSSAWAQKALNEFNGESVWSTPPGSEAIMNPLNEMSSGTREWFTPEEIKSYKSILRKIDNPAIKTAPLRIGIGTTGKPIPDEVADAFDVPRGMNSSDVTLMRRAIRQDTRRQTTGHHGSVRGLLEEASANVPEIERPPGSLYTVNLNVGPKSLLPYDYPIAENEQLFGRITENLPSRAPWFDPGKAGEMTGRDLQMLTRRKGVSPENLSGMLGDIGVPGLYFERGGKRGSGIPESFVPKNYNYVVWDEGVPKIVERRAQGGVVSGDALDARRRYAADLAKIFPKIIDDHYGVA